jgi:hypothetical protein
MKVKQELATTLAVGLLTIAGVGYVTKDVSADTCGIFACGGCFVYYQNCDSCSGSGCDTTGYNCHGACWQCGSDGWKCSG